ncbi:MAG: site-specific integrase [Clostridia bacterium]|nr:site-specific integrase [Clostridia bacterium]
MPKEYRKSFRTGKITAHVRRKPNGSYEIRCQIDGRKISVASKSLTTAKIRFVEKLNGAQPPAAVTQQAEPAAQPVTVREYMKKWLEVVKKPTVKENSYNQYLVYYNIICSAIGDKSIFELKPFEIQEFINNLVSEDKTPTAEQCKILLAAMYEYAVIDDIIEKSPMLKIKVPHHESKEGIPLTYEEEKDLVEKLKNNGDIYIQAYVFMLYTGLRRSELASVEIKDGFVNLISAKGRKGYKIKPRSVPVSPMLQPLLSYIDIESIKEVNINKLTAYAKKYIKLHHTHELRHTFITRCQECGIRREIVSLWAGHAADTSMTTSVYTHLEHNKELQIKEMKKFHYPL